MNNLAWVLATCPVAAVRNGTEALDLALNLNGATNFRNADYLSTLAAAYAELGRYGFAISYEKRAMELKAGKGRSASKERLSHYQQRRAYRDLSDL